MSAQSYETRKICLGALFGVLLGIGSSARAAVRFTDPQISEHVRTASEAEVDTAKEAVERVHHERVRSFARKMVTEHGQSIAELEAIAKSQRVAFDDSAMALYKKASAKAKLGAIIGLKGVEFDRAYMDSQVAMHTQLLKDLDEKFIPDIKNATLKRFLVDTRKHVAGHLKEAQKIRRSL